MYYGWINGFARIERETTRNAVEAEAAARRAEGALERLEDQIQRQALIIRSLLEACTRKDVFSEQEFRELVNEIDLSDGKADGKYKPQPGPRRCPKCGKINGRSAVSCMYCSEDLPDRALV